MKSRRLDKYIDGISKHSDVRINKRNEKIREYFYKLYKDGKTVKDVVDAIAKAQKMEKTIIQVR